LTVIPERDKVLFLRALPVRTLYGVGEVTEEILIKAGLKTIGDVQDYRDERGRNALSPEPYWFATNFLRHVTKGHNPSQTTRPTTD
jgi:hypothetical protein